MTRLIKSKSEMHNTWWIVPVGNIGQIKAKATAKKGLALSLSMESHLNSMQSHTNTLTRSERAGSDDRYDDDKTTKATQEKSHRARTANPTAEH